MGRKPDSSRYFRRTKPHRHGDGPPSDYMYYVVLPGDILYYVSTSRSYGCARRPYRQRAVGYEYIAKRVRDGDIIEVNYGEVPASVHDRFNAVALPRG